SIAEVAVRHIGEVFESQCVVLLPDLQGKLQYPSAKPEPASLRSADLSVAQWVHDHNQPAGLGTDTLPGATARYLPLQASVAKRGALGVLAILPANPRRVLLPEQAHLLETFASQLALALERAELADSAQASAVAAEAESVRSSLLAAISHDMRTPLAVIGGAASALAAPESRLTEQQQRELAQTVVDETAQMTQLIANVLDMTRLESGELKLHLEWVALDEIIGSTLRRLASVLTQHNVSVQLDDELPLIKADPVLLAQLLANLLENAARHTPAGTRVTVRAKHGRDEIEVAVIDDGPGFPADFDPDRLFDKFQRGEVTTRARADARSGAGGVGLGLAICRAIARAHGGEIRAERIPAGGALFVVTLPLSEQAPEVPREVPA
ncbi:MAG: ATP-binding protein, partial [Burkholderiaceae bacterium]